MVHRECGRSRCFHRWMVNTVPQEFGTRPQFNGDGYVTSYNDSDTTSDQGSTRYRPGVDTTRTPIPLRLMAEVLCPPTLVIYHLLEITHPSSFANVPWGADHDSVYRGAYCSRKNPRHVRTQCTNMVMPLSIFGIANQR